MFTVRTVNNALPRVYRIGCQEDKLGRQPDVPHFHVPHPGSGTSHRSWRDGCRTQKEVMEKRSMGRHPGKFGGQLLMHGAYPHNVNHI